MKRILALVLAFLLSSFALADVIEINTETATLSEIDAALITLTEERNARLRAEAEAIEPDLRRDGILFRGIPWHSHKDAIDAALGLRTYWHQDIQRTPEGTIYQGIGASSYLDNGEVTVVGYSPSVRIYYVYPVIDDTLVRDNDSALFYLAEYEFAPAAFGNFAAIKDDLWIKLGNLYGVPQQQGDTFIWTDEYGNQLMYINKNWLTLRYVSHDANKLLQDADAARDRENQAAEEAARAQNTANYDGL